MTKFTWGDLVQVIEGASAALRPGSFASIVGVSEDRQGAYFDRFPPGVIYTIEYGDGESVDIHEDELRLIEAADESEYRS